MSPSSTQACLRTVRANPLGSLTCRAFTTSSRRLRQGVGPESPRYIEVPRPPQTGDEVKPRIKGILPVPRNVFQGNTAKEKSPKAFAEAATPEPVKKPILRPGQDVSLTAWKGRMAASRRANLRAGLRLLKERKVKTEQKIADRSDRKQAARKERLEAPERVDDILTSPSITKQIQALLQRGAGTKTETGSKVLLRRGLAFEKETSRKTSERREALQSLYVHATKFIVSENHLQAEIDKAFGTDERPITWGGHSQATSIWGSDGSNYPPSVTTLLNESNQKAPNALQPGYSEIAKKRIKRIAEEFTGGKISKEVLWE